MTNALAALALLPLFACGAETAGQAQEPPMPQVDVIDFPEQNVPPVSDRLLMLDEDGLCDPAQARCLWMVPRLPKAGDLVMFETQAESWTKSARLSAFGREVTMFRAEDRFRGYAAVPLSPAAKALPIRLTLNDKGPFLCLDGTLTALRRNQSENLRVPKNLAGRRPSRDHDPQMAEWVQPLNDAPFSMSLFEWPSAGQVTSPFFIGRTHNQRATTRHMGLDIRGGVGDSVFVTQTGIIRYVDRHPVSGLTVVVDHGGGVMSYYMHLSRVLKKTGQRVSQGEMIARVGQSGRVTGPHLHFAVSVHGRFVDPEQVLAHPMSSSYSGIACHDATGSHSAR